MHAHTIFTTPRTAVVALSLALGLAGCKSTPPAATDDASVNTQVQTTLSSDQNLGGQSIQASVTDGVVTLNGNVSSDTVRTIASQDVAQIAGVRTVVNNLVISGPSNSGPGSKKRSSQAPASAAARPPATVPPNNPDKGDKAKRSGPVLLSSGPQQQSAPIVRNAPAPAPAAQPAPTPTAAATQPAPPPPPSAPVAHNITLDAGFSIPVRVTQTLDSASSQVGDKFTGAIASDLIVDGMVVLPQGTPVTGHVDDVKDAAHFKGSSLLTISLTSINRKGEHINVATDAYTKEGKGRGKNTAEKVGGGAVVGAILGGILGGGKGAAIGSAAGAGVGAGAQGVTRGQQVQIPSETIVRFRLSESAVVRVTTSPPETSGGALEHHTDQ